jgi:acyl-CoA thioester hydrolase
VLVRAERQAGCEDAPVARHLFELQPRWADMDAFGHVNNATWLEYLQEARVDMLFVHALRQGAEQLAKGVVVAKAEIDYLAPLVFRPRPVPIQLWVGRIGTASFRIDYDVSEPAEDGTPIRYIAASTVLVPIDAATKRPRRLSAVERDILSTYAD